MENIIFTLCSNNYLAQAQTLGQSVLRHNPSCVFIIGLIDRRSAQIDYSKLQDFQLIELDDLSSKDYRKIVGSYSILELATAVKPLYFKHIFENRRASKIIYLDPDVEVYSSLDDLWLDLDENEILLTPHVLSPIEVDGKPHNESWFLKFGVFNLGFLGLRMGDITDEFLGWWSERLITRGKIDSNMGTYVDQKWINFVPVYYEGHFKIIRDPGCNMANWNLHERKLSLDKDGMYVVNDKFPLRFFHFSNFDFSLNSISKGQTRHFLSGENCLKQLFRAYRGSLLNNEYDKLSSLSCWYQDLYLDQSLKEIKGIKKFYFEFFPSIIFGYVERMHSHVKRIKKYRKSMRGKNIAVNTKSFEDERQVSERSRFSDNVSRTNVRTQ